MGYYQKQIKEPKWMNSLRYYEFLSFDICGRFYESKDIGYLAFK